MTRTPIFQKSCLVFELVLIKRPEIVHYLLYGREPRLPVDFSVLPPSQVSSSVREHRARIVQTIEEAHAIARENIQRTQQNMKDRYNRSAREPKFMPEVAGFSEQGNHIQQRSS